MALTTYTELQAEIASWLNKSNLTSNIPTFITLAETDMNRRLRIRLLEQDTTGTLSSGTLDLSSELTRFAKIKQVTLSDSGNRWVQNYISPAQFNQVHFNDETGVPYDYTLVGNEMKFGPAPGSSYEYNIWYYSKIETLSGTVATNSILTNYPDLYLYGSLVAAEPFLKNDKRLSTWKLLYEQSLKMTTQESINDRQGGTSRQSSEMGTP